MNGWLAIENNPVPDDFERAGGSRYWPMKDRDGNEFVAKRATFNNSGYVERGSNREVWPVYWRRETPE